MNRWSWPPIVIGAALLVASSGLARHVFGGILDPDTLATLTEESGLRWTMRLVGLVALVYGVRLYLGTHRPVRSLPTPVEAPPPPISPRARTARIDTLAAPEDPAEAERLGEYRTAGDLYHRQGNYAAAARSYAAAARAEANEQQRDALVRLCVTATQKASTPTVAVDLLASLGRNKEAADIARLHGDVATAAALLVKAGDPQGAVRVYEAAGDAAGAARVLASTGRVNEGVDLLARKDRVAAAELAAEHGETDRAMELFLGAGEAASAAALAASIGNPRRAAEIYRKAGSLELAARSYDQAGAVAEAAELYLQAGHPAQAAELYRKLGDQFGLARCLEAKGLRLDAARSYLELGKLDELLRTLRALPPPDRNSSSPSVPKCLASCGISWKPVTPTASQ